MNFATKHQAFIDEHVARRTGERKGRLLRGHNHAEKLFLRNVWWPMHRNFEHLHPEYEVTDWRNRSYFADFAWINHAIKIIIEIKGYGPHVSDMDRKKYSNELNRETFLLAMGFHVISFTYDDVHSDPDQCIMMLRMVFSRFIPHSTPVSSAVLAEKEIIRLAILHAEPIRPIDIQRHLNVAHNTAVNMIRKLCHKGWFEPIHGPNKKRVVCYRLNVDQLLHFH